MFFVVMFCACLLPVATASAQGTATLAPTGSDIGGFRPLSDVGGSAKVGDMFTTTDLKDFMLETLSRSKIEKTGLFGYDFIKKLIDDHLHGTTDNRKELWTLIVLQLWFDTWY